jgi:Peptidase S24-like
VSRTNPLIERLQRGETVQWRPHGNSMTPRIHSGDLVTVAPVTLAEIQVGDVVFGRVNGREFLHLARAIGQDGRVQISNNHGHVNGWTRTVFGRLVKVEP